MLPPVSRTHVSSTEEQPSVLLRPFSAPQRHPQLCFIPFQHWSPILCFVLSLFSTAAPPSALLHPFSVPTHHPQLCYVPFQHCSTTLSFATPLFSTDTPPSALLRPFSALKHDPQPCYVPFQYWSMTLSFAMSLFSTGAWPSAFLCPFSALERDPQPCYVPFQHWSTILSFATSLFSITTKDTDYSFYSIDLFFFFSINQSRTKKNFIQIHKNTTNFKLLYWWDTGLPTAHSLHTFDALEQAFTPFKFVPRMELTLWIWQWGVCLLSKASHWASAWKKWEHVLWQIYHSPDSDMVVPPSLAVTMTALPRTISSVIQPTFSGTFD